MFIYLDFSAFISAPSSMLMFKGVSVLFYGIYTMAQQINVISIEQWLILISLTGLLSIINSIKIVKRTSLLIESYAFL
jgi:hypothetical protein